MANETTPPPQNENAASSSAAPAATPSVDVTKTWKGDLGAGLVVYLVALPLCLGIALASGAPLLAGLITGIVGGLVVSWASGSPLSVSGPAAGLTVIVLGAIEALDSYSLFLTAVVLSGVIQLVLGFLRAGVVGNFFPNTVIKGMLAAIGAILILKQLPHLVGHDSNPEGDLAFAQADGKNTFSEILAAISDFSAGATLIGLVGLAILVIWPLLKLPPAVKRIPAPLLVVLQGVILNQILLAVAPSWAVSAEHLVSIPVFSSAGELFGVLAFPDFGGIASLEVWKIAATIAIIASIETLLCVEAVDKQDPLRRTTPLNRELKAQGLGNLLAGLIGGIPMTAVIVRGSANVQAGGLSHLSSFFHGIFLFLSVVFLGAWLNQIPLAALAAVLIFIGYKLAPISLFIDMARQGGSQLAPFLITFFAILFTDLLSGVMFGVVVGLGFILRENFRQAASVEIKVTDEDGDGLNERSIILDHHVSFLNKAAIRAALEQVQPGEQVCIDATRSFYVDPDVIAVIENFQVSARDREIEVTVIGLKQKPEPAEPAKAEAAEPA